MLRKAGRILIPAVLALILIILPACGEIKMTRIGDFKISEIPGFTMKTEFDTYKSNTKSIKVIIQNNSDSKIEYGDEWRIDYFDGSSWYTLDDKDNYAFTRLLHWLEPGESKDLELSMDVLASGKLPKGLCRVVKSFGNEEAGSMLVCEFNVE